MSKDVFMTSFRHRTLRVVWIIWQK